MRRREFLSIVCGGWFTNAFSAYAQDVSRPIGIGVLPLGSPASQYDQWLVAVCRQRLLQLGLVEGRDIAVDVVWVGNEAEYGSTSTEMLARGARLLVTAGTSASVAAKRATSSIPIVFITVGDPVGVGLVDNLSNPNGNATGFSDILLDLSSKYVDISVELRRPEVVVDYLWHTAWPNGEQRYQATERAAHAAHASFRPQGIKEIVELNDAMSAMKRDGAITLLIQPSPFTYKHRSLIIDSARDQGLSTIFAWPVAGREGALIAYGPEYANMYRGAANYVGRILRGAKPADLPVEQPAKLELVANIKTAKALGLTIPASLLARADEVIE